MFRIRIGKLFVETIQLNSYTDDFNEAKKFKECDYFYLDIIKLLLELDNIEKLVVLDPEDTGY